MARDVVDKSKAEIPKLDITCIMHLPSAPYRILGLSGLLDTARSHFTSSSPSVVCFPSHAAAIAGISEYPFIFILDLCNVPSTKFSRPRAIFQSPTAGSPAPPRCHDTPKHRSSRPSWRNASKAFTLPLTTRRPPALIAQSGKLSAGTLHRPLRRRATPATAFSSCRLT